VSLTRCLRARPRCSICGTSFRFARATLLCLALLFLGGCALRPRPPADGVGAADALALAVARDTSAQQALVGDYLHLVHDHRYADAWELLSPERQKRESLDQLVASWRSRGEVSFAYPPALVTWPGAYDEVRAMVVLMRENDGSRTQMIFTLVPVQGNWRITGERAVLPSTGPEPPPPRTIDQLIRHGIDTTWGSLWVPTARILEQEPFQDGQIVLYRVLVPSNDDQGSIYREVLLAFVRPYQGGWGFFGGGYIGTVISIDARYAVQCAWTWISMRDGVAGFYCLVQDPRIATVELVRKDGGVMRQLVNGRPAIAFPYLWDEGHKRWPDQHPRAIHLYDSRGRPLDLPMFPPP